MESETAMRNFFAFFLITSFFALANTATATEVDDFIVDTADDLATLCATPVEDPMHQQALHFCHGYLVGAYHYHVKSTSGVEGANFVCMPDPAPSREQVISEFVAWLDTNPAKLNEDAVDALCEWAAGRFPC